MIREMEDETNDFNNIIVLEKNWQNDSDHEKFNALGEVSKYLKSCTNPLIINTLFLKLARIFKDLPDILKIELKEVLKSCIFKFAFSLNINDFLNIFAQSLDSIDSLAKCQVIEIIELFGPFCVDRYDLFHRVFDIFINTKMKYEKQVAAATLKSLHQVHVNFSKTLLKNMHSYIHNQKSEDCFKRVVQLLPLASQSLNMELLELYLTILSKLLNDLILLSSKKHHSLRKRRRFAILKIVLTAMLECSTNFTILREFVFNLVFQSCKKAFEAKFDLAPLLNDFLIIFLCKFSASIDERCFKQSVELVYSVQGAEDKNQTRLLYCIHATFPNFFDTYRILSPLKDRIRPINFESFEHHYMNNTELYKIETFIEDLGLLNKHFSAFRREFDKMKNYFVFVNIFCFKKKFTMHLAPVEEKFLTLIVLLFAKLLKESCFPLLQSFTILLSFFSNVFTSFDKKLLSFLGGIPKEELFRYNNQEMRKIGVILLTHNMPRSSSFFFYRPRKESRRIKFFTYFDCCKRLASLKANKKSGGAEFNEELNRLIVILASLKEFRFSEEYLQTLQQILNELHIAIDGFIETENNQAAPNVQLILERLQAGIGRMDEIASFHLDNDPISRYSVKVLARFLSTVFKFLESYEKLDQHSIRKIRQSLHEFLVPKGMIYSAELYLFFKAKKFLGLIDSVIERNMNIGEAKVSLLKFILEVDFLMLPKRVFISMRSPQLFVCQKFLWQLKDENKLSSLKEHIIETELEVKYIKEAELRDWSIECDLVAKDTLFFNTKFKKQAIKSAKNLISFQFLVTFESICKHKLDMTIKLINRCGLLMDKIELEGEIDII